ncbi:unnamed protein product [Urochloa humidicola]
MAAITGGRALTVAALLCTMAATAMAAQWSTSNVRATNHLYFPEQNGWDLNSANIYCAPWDANKPLWWRERFGWAAICEPWRGPGFCGQCIKVTNHATGQWIVARIVDKCTGGGLKLDYETMFKKIDTDGQGFEKGYLKVDYEWVSCDK